MAVTVKTWPNNSVQHLYALNHHDEWKLDFSQLFSARRQIRQIACSVIWCIHYYISAALHFVWRTSVFCNG